MARMPRVVIPGIPHHVVQRGNRRMRTFFSDDDYEFYLREMAFACQRCLTQIWAYCLMPNHVHLILTPAHEDGLRAATAEAHRRYTLRINLRETWRGHLWQERFHSFPMDEAYLLAAVRYVELNPVTAGLVREPEAWRWSSAGARIRGEDSEVLTLSPLREMVSDWSSFLGQTENVGEAEILRLHGRTGRPLGDSSFCERLERLANRTLMPNRRGPPPGRKAS